MKHSETLLAQAYPADRLILREVGLRDGLQLTRQFPSTVAKRDWITREYAAGVRHFEVGSFLPPRRFPQFADVREIVSTVAALEGAHSIALALNERGASDALQTEVNEVTLVISASEAHNLANARRPQAQSLTEIANVVRLRDEAGASTLLSVGISMAFGCSLSGAVDPGEVERIATACLEAGVDKLGVADTVGYVGPRQVGELCRRMSALMPPERPYAVHLHDTRGMGIANAHAALAAGARVLDASLGGLGGCPFAPGATGNVVMEDLVYLAEISGFATGIDLEALCAVRAIPRQAMPDEPLYGALAQAGVPQKFAWRAEEAGRH
ncbi:MAG: hydroxymethylglutaryl-CoA lyase [Thiothrix sp.]|nr:hydroxymethylglutaryl-CoA lyase [Thiothrix sp.]HPE59739.1 hydroxymethylglutaryl-CoA lyase [Thiolinea sp.]